MGGGGGGVKQCRQIVVAQNETGRSHVCRTVECIIYKIFNYSLYFVYITIKLKCGDVDRIFGVT